jgi:hypothetical protein
VFRYTSSDVDLGLFGQSPLKASMSHEITVNSFHFKVLLMVVTHNGTNAASFVQITRLGPCIYIGKQNGGSYQMNLLILECAHNR